MLPNLHIQVKISNDIKTQKKKINILSINLKYFLFLMKQNNYDLPLVFSNFNFKL